MLELLRDMHAFSSDEGDGSPHFIGIFFSKNAADTKGDQIVKVYLLSGKRDM